MMCNPQNYWVSGLRPSSGILKKLQYTTLRRETPTLLDSLESANLSHWISD
jgi:hypothetical protein